MTDKFLAKASGLVDRSCPPPESDVPISERIYLLHIGKTGGTALKSALRRGNSSVLFCKHPVVLEDIPRGSKCIFFLRNPYDRFLSAFHSRKNLGRPRYDSRWNKFEEKIFTRFPTASDLASAMTDESHDSHELARSSLRMMQHFRPLFYWFKDAAYLTSRKNDVLFCGFTETLDADFEVLKKLLALPTDLVLPQNDIEAHRFPAEYKVPLSAEAKASLSRVYREDFECIELCRMLFRSKAHAKGE